MTQFKVRQASTLAILAVVLIVAGTVLGLLAAVVALQPGQMAAGDWVWLAIGGAVAMGAGVALFVVAFIKLCTNVEYLVREEMGRHGG